MHDHRDHRDHPASVSFDSADAAAFAELEAEVLGGFVTTAGAVLAELCGREGVTVRRLLDIGCGPGVATCCLAQRFASARVVAVDGSPAMLERAGARAARLGLTERVEVRLAQLPEAIHTLGRADVVLASMVLHHVGDTAGALGAIGRLLQPRGVLAI